MRLLSFCVLAALAVPAHAASPVNGRWLTDDRKAIVEIGKCGASLCGRVVRVLAADAPPTDRNNPDPQLRSRPIEGLAVLTGFTDAGEHWAGRIYSPEEGRTYRSELALKPDGNLRVKGCWTFICKSLTWTRAR